MSTFHVLIDYIIKNSKNLTLITLIFSQRHFVKNNKLTFVHNNNCWQRNTHWFIKLTKLNVKTNNAQRNTKNETIFESNETHNITFKNNFFHSIRNKVRSISFFEFQFSLNILKRALRFNETQISLKRIIYFNMFQYANHNTRDIQT